MGKLVIDSHSHLWLRQDTTVDGKRILSLKNGRSIFMDEEVQMLPPFMIDGQNTAEVFLSNMNYPKFNKQISSLKSPTIFIKSANKCKNSHIT